jgi:hypothetical protein
VSTVSAKTPGPDEDRPGERRDAKDPPAGLCAGLLHVLRVVTGLQVRRVRAAGFEVIVRINRTRFGPGTTDCPSMSVSFDSEPIVRQIPCNQAVLGHPAGAPNGETRTRTEDTAIFSQRGSRGFSRSRSLRRGVFRGRAEPGSVAESPVSKPKRGIGRAPAAALAAPGVASRRLRRDTRGCTRIHVGYGRKRSIPSKPPVPVRVSRGPRICVVPGDPFGREGVMRPWLCCARVGLVEAGRLARSAGLGSHPRRFQRSAAYACRSSGVPLSLRVPRPVGAASVIGHMSASMDI